LTDLEYLSDLGGHVKSDGVRNLCTGGSKTLFFNNLVVFNDLIKMIMECFTNFSELFTSLVLLAESEYLPSSVVVELEQLGVGTESI
jgi:hypothetical protein